MDSPTLRAISWPTLSVVYAFFILLISYTIYRIFKPRHSAKAKTIHNSVYIVYSLNTKEHIQLYGALENIINWQSMRFLIIYGNRVPLRFIYSFKDFKHVELIHYSSDGDIKLQAISQIHTKSQSMLAFRNPAHRIYKSEIESIKHFMTVPETIMRYDNTIWSDYMTVKAYQNSQTNLQNIQSKYEQLSAKSLISNKHEILMAHISQIFEDNILTYTAMADKTCQNPSLVWPDLKLGDVQYFCPKSRAFFLEYNEKLM